MAEYSKGKLKKYGKVDESTGQTYYGRGYVQLTWKTNYEKYDGILKSKGLLEANQSIVTNPELVKNPKIAAFILVHGMMYGTFTGKKLSTYINDAHKDWGGARYTVNGQDKKIKIARKAQQIFDSL